jgi:hypothetical protein
LFLDHGLKNVMLKASMQGRRTKPVRVLTKEGVRSGQATVREASDAKIHFGCLIRLPLEKMKYK